MRFTPDPPARPPYRRPSHSTLRASVPRLLSRRKANYPPSFHPKVPNVCGTIRQKFQVRHGRVRRLYDEFPPSRSLFPASRASAERTRLPTRLGPYKRRTRVILIRTRPRGAEVKASFLLGVSTKTPLAFARVRVHGIHAYTYMYMHAYISERARRAFSSWNSRKRTPFLSP